MSELGKRIDRNQGEPVYAQVRNRLRELISNGSFLPGQQLPPEPEIARLLGVSRMTANKAILSLVSEGWIVREKGRGTFVAPDPGVSSTLRCVVAINEDLDGALRDFYFGALYGGLHRELADLSIGLDVVRIGPGFIDSPEVQGAGGLVAINPPESILEDLLRLENRGVPVILLGSSWTEGGLSWIDSDNVLGALHATNHLIDLGHQQILFIGACPNDSNTRDRVRGYQLALKGRGVAIDEQKIVLVPYASGYRDADAESIAHKLRPDGGITAVFAAGAQIAMQTLGLLQRMGRAVPDDCSLVAFDDPVFLSLTHPPFTTVRQPLAEMAHAARMLLLDRIRSGDPRPVRRSLDPELVIRGTTTGPPRPR